LTSRSLYRLIDLKEGEEKTVGLFIGYSFCMGVAVAIFYTATTSLFLLSFERTMLPKAYIVGGVVVYALGVITSYIQKQIRFSYLINGLIYFLMFSVTGLVISYQFSDVKWFIFFLFVWNRVFVFVNGITFWSTAARLFNLQQAKRLFGLISTGEVISSILSYFSVPLLLKFMATEQLLYIVALAVGACILLMSLIIRRFSEQLAVVAKPAPREATSVDDSRSWKRFLANPYYLLVFLLAMLPVVGLFFVDFMFAVESKEVFPDKELLASFLGVFFGFCALVEILIKTVLYNKLMARFGLTLGVALLPLTLLFSVTLAVSYGTVYGTTALFFAFIVLSRFFMSSVRKSVNEPSFQVLMQPIPASERSEVQSRIEGGPKALGNIVPGVILLLLTSVSFIGTVEIAAFFLLILIGWLYVALKVQGQYRGVLRTLLEKSQVGVRRSLDAYQYAAWRLAEARRTAVLSSERSSFEFIIKLADSARIADRVLAAGLLGESGRYFAHKYLARLINDEAQAVQNAALIAAASVRSPELWPLLIGCLDKDPTHESAAYGLLGVGEPILRELARSFGRSAGNTVFQLRLIRVMKQIGGAKAIKFLRSVLNYPDPHVRDEVYEALKQLGYQVTITERTYLVSEINDRIGLLVWLLAAQRDLEVYPMSSSIQVALESEKHRIVPQIFTLLSLLPGGQQYDYVSDLLLKERGEAQGYLLEVMNMTLPDEWKSKLIPLFEDEPLPEKLKHCAADYPQQYLSPGERLSDMVNRHFSRVSSWLKATALHELARLPQDSSLILAAHAVAPDEVIAEIALLALYRSNPSRFESLQQVIEAQNDTFHLKICHRIRASPSDSDLLWHRVGVLRRTHRFAQRPEEELLTVAPFLTKYNLTAGQTASTDWLVRPGKALWLVASGVLTVQSEGGTIEQLGPFEWCEITAAESKHTTIWADEPSEIYCMDEPQLAHLQAFEYELETPVPDRTVGV
jgi:ATP:ADP antiporter, AAA family